MEGTSPGRGENQREKSKVPHCQWAVLYYARLQSGPSLGTHWPCTTWIFDQPCILWLTLDPRSKVEQISDMRVEQSLERKVEWSSDLKSGMEWSSDLEVEWNLEQQKCEMGHPLTGSTLVPQLNITQENKHRITLSFKIPDSAVVSEQAQSNRIVWTN